MKAFALVIIIIMVGCSDHKSSRHSANVNNTDNPIVNDSNWTTRLSLALNLPRLEKGVDSFELRLWSSLLMTDLKVLTTLRFSGGQWHCSISRYWIGTFDEWGKNRSAWADSVQTKKIIPTIPFEELLDSIKGYEVWNIPTQQDISGFVDKTADGMLYILEIAKSNKYHSITYRNPDLYTDSNNKKFSSLLQLLSGTIDAFVTP